MAIAFRAASAVAGAQETAPVDLVIDKPSGTLDGDIMLAVIYYYKNVVSHVATPTCAGWTEITHYHLDVYHAVVVLWKRASSEGSNYTFTSSDGTMATGAIVSYSDCVGSGDPVDVYSSTGYTTINTTVRAAGVTTTQDHDLLVFLGMAGYWGRPTNPSTPPSGFSERVDSNYDDDWAQIVVSDDEQATAGASGNKDATLTSSVGAAKHAFLVALTPSDPGLSIPLLNHLLLGD